MSKAMSASQAIRASNQARVEAANVAVRKTERRELRTRDKLYSKKKHRRGWPAVST